MPQVLSKKIFKLNNDLSHPVWITGLRTGEKVNFIDLPVRNKDEYYYVKNMITKSFGFFIKSTERRRSYDLDFDKVWSLQVNGVKDRKKQDIVKGQLFSKELFLELGIFFIQFIDEFTVSYVAEFKETLRIASNRKDSFLDAVKKFKTNEAFINLTFRDEMKHIKISTLRQILRDLETQGFDEMIKSGLYSKRMLYYYKAFLKNYGIEKGASAADPVNYSYDFEAYNLFIQRNYKQMRGLEIRF